VHLHLDGFLGRFLGRWMAMVLTSLEVCGTGIAYLSRVVLSLDGWAGCNFSLLWNHNNESNQR